MPDTDEGSVADTRETAADTQTDTDGFLNEEVDSETRQQLLERGAERGEWHVEIGHNIFGDPTLRHGLDGAVLIMGLPKRGGWTPISAVKLAHQVRVEEVVTWLEEQGPAHEVAILAVDQGEWTTVWTAHSHDPCAETRAQATNNACEADSQ